MPVSDNAPPTAEETAGQELRRLRTARGWSQDEVAQRMSAYGYDWHQTLIGRIESAQRPLRLNEAVDLAALFGVTLESLLPRTAPDIDDQEELLLRISAARGRLRRAESEYEKVHAVWDAATAELAVAGKADMQARALLDHARGELEYLRRFAEQSEARKGQT